jgi:hypothetical protein
VRKRERMALRLLTTAMEAKNLGALLEAGAREPGGARLHQ